MGGPQRPPSDLRNYNSDRKNSNGIGKSSSRCTRYNPVDLIFLTCDVTDRSNKVKSVLIYGGEQFVKEMKLESREKIDIWPSLNRCDQFLTRKRHMGACEHMPMFCDVMRGVSFRPIRRHIQYWPYYYEHPKFLESITLVWLISSILHRQVIHPSKVHFQMFKQAIACTKRSSLLLVARTTKRKITCLRKLPI